MTLERAAKFTTTALAAALAASGAAAFAAAPLLPLSQKDMMRTHDMGCNFLFDVGKATRVFAIGSELVIRTADGLSLCRLGERPIGEFMEGKRAVSCGGRTLRLMRLGRTAAHQESDSADWPARLTITHGKTSQALRGSAGTAC